MATHVLYSQDADSEVSVLGVSDSVDALKARAVEFESVIIDETGETIEWAEGLIDVYRAEFHELDYWIVPVERV